MSKPLRVAVISRHELTRAGLTQLIAARPRPSSRRRGGPRSIDPADHDVAVYDLAGREATEDDDLRTTHREQDRRGRRSRTSSVPTGRTAPGDGSGRRRVDRT